MHTSRRRLRRTLILGGAAALCGWNALAADSWEPMRQAKARDEVSTWVRPVAGMAVKEFRGLTEVHATAWVVLAVLADTPKLSRWVFHGKSSQQIAGTPPDQAYLQFKGVWPASDRDVHIRTYVSQQPDATIVVDSRQVDGQRPQDGHVRIPSLQNVFRLTPMPGGWTRVEFSTLIDLGGLVPAWLANTVATQAPLQTLQNLHQQVTLPAYQIKSAAELPQHFHRAAPLVLPEAHLKSSSP